ncbi:type II toxin-antitoxin system RelE/ParE family toxin [Chryseobacterium sp. Leaf201]
MSRTPYYWKKNKPRNVRVKIIRDYLIFYEFSESELVILSIWDGRRDINR